MNERMNDLLTYFMEEGITISGIIANAKLNEN